MNNLIDSERNYLAEAKALLAIGKPHSCFLPELEHLKAIEEYYECRLIIIVNQLEELKRAILR